MLSRAASSLIKPGTRALSATAAIPPKKYTVSISIVVERWERNELTTVLCICIIRSLIMTTMQLLLELVVQGFELR